MKKWVSFYRDTVFNILIPGSDRPARRGRQAREAGRREDPSQRGEEPRRGQARGGRQQDGQALGQLLHAGDV